MSSTSQVTVCSPGVSQSLRSINGVELAESDGEKANILDTAAEICNALGNCDEAVAKMKQAIELNP